MSFSQASGKDETLFIGTMSGTSHDGIDAALIETSNAETKLLTTLFKPLPEQLREKLLNLNSPDYQGPLEEHLGLEQEFTHCVAELILELLDKSGLAATAITAAGCHGHTVRHRPQGTAGYSLQLLSGAALAVNTGIPVVCDFRSADIALGGTGAPLAPSFHHHFFARDGVDTAVVNVGGIANVTIINSDGTVTTGYDTGPGNLLLDFCASHFEQQPYDKEGAMARSGTIVPELLDQLLNHPFLKKTPPKSTGREEFNSQWLLGQCDRLSATPSLPDLLATLTELTAQTIITSIKESGFGSGEILVCGGGVHNRFLMERLTLLAGDCPLASTSTRGFDPDWIEAMGFAWLASRRWRQQPGNVPSVTGARRPAILGGLYLP